MYSTAHILLIITIIANNNDNKRLETKCPNASVYIELPANHRFIIIYLILSNVILSTNIHYRREPTNTNRSVIVPGVCVCASADNLYVHIRAAQLCLFK